MIVREALASAFADAHASVISCTIKDTGPAHSSSNAGTMVSVSIFASVKTEQTIAGGWSACKSEQRRWAGCCILTD